MDKNASELMAETFNKSYRLWKEYVDFVLLNLIIFDLLEDRTDYKDHNLLEMDLTLRL